MNASDPKSWQIPGFLRRVIWLPTKQTCDLGPACRIEKRAGATRKEVILIVSGVIYTVSARARVAHRCRYIMALVEYKEPDVKRWSAATAVLFPTQPLRFGTFNPQLYRGETPVRAGQAQLRDKDGM